MNVRPSYRVLGLVAFGTAVAGLHAAETDVQRQLLQREQQQMELRLKMQQQLDRPLQGPTASPFNQAGPLPQAPRADARRRNLERDQQQRLQMLHDQQLRIGISAPEVGQVQREIERQRALNASGTELQRFGIERQPNAGSAAPGP